MNIYMPHGARMFWVGIQLAKIIPPVNFRTGLDSAITVLRRDTSYYFQVCMICKEYVMRFGPNMQRKHRSFEPKM